MRGEEGRGRRRPTRGSWLKPIGNTESDGQGKKRKASLSFSKGEKGPSCTGSERGEGRGVEDL